MRLRYDSFLAYSEKNDKCFYTKFIDGVNIVYGKNTSGKSTLMQTILYTFGINNEKKKLEEVLAEEVFFRLDFTLFENNIQRHFILIRDNEKLLINEARQPFKVFNGISGDNAVEHIKLKKYMHELFSFSLYLEKNGDYKSAPIETIFLPYYISQDVGWVYLRKSFSSLDFYKNFKEDFIDYFMGLDTGIDRIEKQKLEKELKEINIEMDFYNSIEKTNEDFKIVKMVDETFMEESKKYIDKHKERQATLIQDEKQYILKCNELSYKKERLSILRKVTKNLETQNPQERGTCPICTQLLPLDTVSLYEYLQDVNDTQLEVEKIKQKEKKIQSDINSLEKKINNARVKIEEEYELLKQYEEEKITYDKWLKYKANIQLIENITIKLGKLSQKKSDKVKQLNEYKSNEDIEQERKKINNSFSKEFKKYLTFLNVKKLDNQRYTQLYNVSSFPYQGTELHKTVMAYHFAFNKIIEKRNFAHRLPFMLDAIFKEDIDIDNKKNIIDFIAEYKPIDTQVLMSVAESDEKEIEKSVEDYNQEYFKGKANLICIGDKKEERAFLSHNDGKYNDLIEETLDILYSN